jgi:hypothetical protein
MSSKYSFQDERRFYNGKTKQEEYALEIHNGYFVVQGYVEHDCACFKTYDEARECYEKLVKARL